MKRAWLLGPALLLVACATPTRPSPSLPATPGGSVSPGGSAGGSPGASLVATPGVTTATGPSGSLGPQGSSQVAVDETLLRFLPASIGAITIAYSADATQSVLNDATLARNASAIAYGLAIDQASNDFVVAAVARLRPGVFSEGFYRDWRSTYDRGACAQAGGIAGTAETTIAGRIVYIGSCRGGAHTYHVHLELAAIQISATSVGAKRFGEQLVANLRP